MATGIFNSLKGNNFKSYLYIWKITSFLYFSGEEIPQEYSMKILVPFCVESALSGIKKPVAPTDKMVYRTVLTVPPEWGTKKLRLHFEAVDYETTVYVDDEIVGIHYGGYDSFHVDIRDKRVDGNNEERSHKIVVVVTDPTQTKPIPVGKQWTGI